MIFKRGDVCRVVKARSDLDYLIGKEVSIVDPGAKLSLVAVDGSGDVFLFDNSNLELVQSDEDEDYYGAMGDSLAMELYLRNVKVGTIQEINVSLARDCIKTAKDFIETLREENRG